MKNSQKVYKEYKKNCKEELSKKKSLRLNQKVARKIRKQADFIPSEEREYVTFNTKYKVGTTIFCKQGSPREVYKFLKKDISARI